MTVNIDLFTMQRKEDNQMLLFPQHAFSDLLYSCCIWEFSSLWNAPMCCCNLPSFIWDSCWYLGCHSGISYKDKKIKHCKPSRSADQIGILKKRLKSVKIRKHSVPAKHVGEKQIWHPLLWPPVSNISFLFVADWLSHVRSVESLF